MSIVRFLILIGFVFSMQISEGQNRQSLKKFNSIDVFGKIEVRLEKSDSNSIVFNSDDDLNKMVSYFFEDSILFVRLLKEFPKGRTAKILINYKELLDITVAGGVHVYNKGAITSDIFNIASKSGSESDLLINSREVNVIVNNGGFARLTGTAQKLNIKTSTGGNLVASELTCEEVIAVINGGKAEVNVSELLDANVRLGGVVQYVKKPNKIIKSKFLGGEVKAIEKF